MLFLCFFHWYHQAALSPIAAAFQMDPVERALRVGGEREVAKKSEEDAGTIAGNTRVTRELFLQVLGVQCGTNYLFYYCQRRAPAFHSAFSMISLWLVIAMCDNASPYMGQGSLTAGANTLAQLQAADMGRLLRQV